MDYLLGLLHQNIQDESILRLVFVGIVALMVASLSLGAMYLGAGILDPMRKRVRDVAPVKASAEQGLSAQKLMELIQPLTPLAMPKHEKEQASMRQRLTWAGYRNANALGVGMDEVMALNALAVNEALKQALAPVQEVLDAIELDRAAPLETLEILEQKFLEARAGNDPNALAEAATKLLEQTERTFGRTDEYFERSRFVEASLNAFQERLVNMCIPASIGFQNNSFHSFCFEDRVNKIRGYSRE